jgi:DNA-3-methyladenine glycosylase II
VAAHLFWAYYHVVKRREGISLQAKKPAAKPRKTIAKKAARKRTNKTMKKTTGRKKNG